jgi:hypothetical protein
VYRRFPFRCPGDSLDQALRAIVQNEACTWTKDFRDPPAFQTYTCLAFVQVYDSGNIPATRINTYLTVNEERVYLILLFKTVPVSLELLQTILPHFCYPIQIENNIRRQGSKL